MMNTNAKQDGTTDIVVWLESKLGSSEELWCSRNLCPHLSLDVLNSIAQVFVDLQPHSKIKVLLSMVHYSKRNLDTWRDPLEDIINLALQDADDWVQMVAQLLREFPTTSALNFNMESADNLFVSTLEELRKCLKKAKDAPCFSQLMPVEAAYMNKNALTATFGTLPQVEKHFALKRKSKAAALRTELLQKAGDAATHLKTKGASSSSFCPIKQRSSMRSDDDSSPLKGLIQNPVKSSAGFGQTKTFNRPAFHRKEGGIKLLDIDEVPSALKLKQKFARLKSSESTERKEKDAQESVSAEMVASKEPATPGEGVASPFNEELEAEEDGEVEASAIIASLMHDEELSATSKASTSAASTNGMELLAKTKLDARRKLLPQQSHDKGRDSDEEGLCEPEFPVATEPAPKKPRRGRKSVADVDGAKAEKASTVTNADAKKFVHDDTSNVDETVAAVMALTADAAKSMPENALLNNKSMDSSHIRDSMNAVLARADASFSSFQYQPHTGVSSSTSSLAQTVNVDAALGRLLPQAMHSTAPSVPQPRQLASVLPSISSLAANQASQQRYSVIVDQSQGSTVREQNPASLGDRHAGLPAFATLQPQQFQQAPTVVLSNNPSTGLPQMSFVRSVTADAAGGNLNRLTSFQQQQQPQRTMITAMPQQMVVVGPGGNLQSVGLANAPQQQHQPQQATTYLLPPGFVFSSGAQAQAHPQQPFAFQSASVSQRVAVPGSLDVQGIPGSVVRARGIAVSPSADASPYRSSMSPFPVGQQQIYRSIFAGNSSLQTAGSTNQAQPSNHPNPVQVAAVAPFNPSLDQQQQNIGANVPAGFVPKPQQLTISKEVMMQAQEMFRTANKLSRPEKALILGFMAGSRDNPCPHLGNILTVKLSESRESAEAGGGAAGVLTEHYFQMNYATGTWKKLTKQRVIEPGEARVT